MKKQEISNHLDQACKAIQSSIDKDQEWVVNYLSSTHKQRILDDCIIVDGILNNRIDAVILELGAAPFYTGLTLQNMGYSLTGIDINPERFNNLTERVDIEIIKCDIEKEQLPFKDNSFDIVLLAEVFEHLRLDLIFTISEIRRVLKPGGKLILSTPNFFDFTKLGELVFQHRTTDIYNAYVKLQEMGHMGHVREYTRRDVVRFLEKTNFSIDRSYYRGVSHISIPSFYQIRRMLTQKLVPFLRIWFVIVASK